METIKGAKHTIDVDGDGYLVTNWLRNRPNTWACSEGFPLLNRVLAIGPNSTFTTIVAILGEGGSNQQTIVHSAIHKPALSSVIYYSFHYKME